MHGITCNLAKNCSILQVYPRQHTPEELEDFRNGIYDNADANLDSLEFLCQLTRSPMYGKYGPSFRFFLVA